MVVDWLVSAAGVQSVGCLACWFGWLAGWLLACFVASSVCWLVGWRVGWLLGLLWWPSSLLSATFVCAVVANADAVAFAVAGWLV